MNLKVIQVKYFLTWCIINLGNSSDTIKTKSLAGLKMYTKWQKLHKDRNVQRMFIYLHTQIHLLPGVAKKHPRGKARHNDWAPCISAMDRLGLSNGLVELLSIWSLRHIFEGRGRVPLQLPKNAIRKYTKRFQASQLWGSVEVITGEMVRSGRQEEWLWNL